MKRVRRSTGDPDISGPESIDELYRRLVGQGDNSLPLPSIGGNPHLLTNKIRKHYFEAVIKMLSVNYENSQRLLGKNLRLPSAIWRCAKYIEVQAVQACMLMELYRENILSVIKELKSDTENGKLYKKLFDCLLQPPINDKSTQTVPEAKPAVVKKRKRHPPVTNIDMDKIYDSIEQKKVEPPNEQYQIPVVINVQTDTTLTSQYSQLNGVRNSCKQTIHTKSATIDQSLPNASNQNTSLDNVVNTVPDLQSHSSFECDPLIAEIPSNLSTLPTVVNTEIHQTTQKETNQRLSIESMDVEDQVMLEMEKLFQTNESEEDIFDGALYTNIDINDNKKDNTIAASQQTPEVVLDNHEPANAPTSLDERIAMLSSSGALVPPVVHKQCQKTRKSNVSKWVCELYFQRLKLTETMDHLVENNRRKHDRVKLKFIELFGEDDEEYSMMSPLEETTDFISSCNERIAPHVVKNLMKYYSAGRIRSKDLFKSIAKSIMDKIIACNRFPDEYEVYTFISDYFKSRPVIKCVADVV